MKLRFLGLLSLALCVCLTSMVDAQPPQRGQRGQGGQQGGGGRGGFGGGRGGGGFEQGAALELMGLLRMEEVRKEVDVDDATYEAMREGQPDMRALFQASEEERTKALKEANDKAQEMLDEVVSPDNLKRLMGLLVQQRGYSAATNDLIANEVGVSDADQKKIQSAVEEVRNAQRDKMREAFQSGGGGGERPDFAKMMEEARAETEKAVGKVLSADQKKKLDDLKGAKFDFPEQQFGRGGPPGAGGGRGGDRGGRPAGGRGDRPGN